MFEREEVAETAWRALVVESPTERKLATEEMAVEEVATKLVKVKVPPLVKANPPASSFAVHGVWMTSVPQMRLPRESVSMVDAPVQLARVEMRSPPPEMTNPPAMVEEAEVLVTPRVPTDSPPAKVLVAVVEVALKVGAVTRPVKTPAPETANGVPGVVVPTPTFPF